METNTFAVFLKAFVEKFHGARPNMEQWDCIVKILNEVPTTRLTSND